MQETHLPESCSTDQDNLNGSNNLEFADALFDAGAVVITQLRQQWAKDLELMQAQCRELIALLRADSVEDKHKFMEDVNGCIAQLKNGMDGEP